MSSFIGHSLAAVTVYVATEFVILPSSDRQKQSWFKSDRLVWLGWLIVIASIPDLDYVVKPWNSSNNQGLRITHSILFSLIAPCFSVLALLLLKSDRVWRRSIQVVLAGLSHLILDLSVGVTPLPLLFPLIKIPFRLPFGILPSAGRIDLDNYYFYRNLRLEMGVLLPLFAIACLLAVGKVYGQRINSILKFCGSIAIAVLFFCINHFVRQNLQLPR